jgi:3-methyladenine DNA glycosylase AlkC
MKGGTALDCRYVVSARKGAETLLLRKKILFERLSGLKFHKTGGIKMDNKIFKVAGIIGLIFLLLPFFSESSIALSDTVQRLKSRDPAIRMEAARALGEAKDPAAISALVTTLKKDRDGYVRAAAEDALVNIGSPALNSLQPLLKDKSWRVRRRAVRTIGRIKDFAAVDSLIQATKTDDDCYVKKFAAKSLGEIKDDRAVEFLCNGLKERNVYIIAGAYRFFLRRGEAGTEEALVKALHTSFNRNMIDDFANCGNIQLREAALKYSEGRYSVKSPPRWEGPRWGEGL